MSLTTPTVTGYSAFWRNILGTSQPGYSMYTGQARSRAAYHIAKLMKNGGTRDATGALAALIGAASGGTATNQYKRRQGPSATSTTVPGTTGVGALGGAIPIETIDAINRATTAADVTELKKWFNNTLLEAGITYPTVSGSGGGGMQTGGTGRF